MSDKIEVRENCVKMQRRGGGKERGKEIILSKPAFISLTVRGRGGVKDSLLSALHGVPLSPHLPTFFTPPAPFSSLSPLTAVSPLPPPLPPTPSLNAPRHCRIRPTFMTAAALHSRRMLCPKRLSDKAMNTLSGSSLLVSLRSAGHRTVILSEP